MTADHDQGAMTSLGADDRRVDGAAHWDEARKRAAEHVMPLAIKRDPGRASGITRIDSLDGIRGWAALMVIVFHVF